MDWGGADEEGTEGLDGLGQGSWGREEGVVGGRREEREGGR